MSRRRITGRVALALATLACALAACATAAPTADLVVANVTIYDGTGSPPFTGSIVVRGGVIDAIPQANAPPPTAAERVDGAGKYLVPGLWDMHVHTRAGEGAGLDVAAFPKHGVTSVRDLGGYIDRIKALQANIAKGTPGPAIYSSYTTLNGKTFGNFQRAITTEAQANAVVDELAQAGAVQIKVHRALSPDLLPVVLRRAHERGLTVTGHIPLGLHPLKACELGMDGIEHVGSFLEAYISVTPKATPDAAIAYMLSDAAEPLYDCLASRGVEVTPTLVVYPAVARARAKGGAMPEGAQAFIDSVGRIALRLHRKRVTLLAGTDTSDLDVVEIEPGASLIDELEMMQRAGIPQRDIISIATANAARTLGVAQRTGTIEAGKAADFLLLDADPGIDARHFRKPFAVYRAGSSCIPDARAGDLSCIPAGVAQ